MAVEVYVSLPFVMRPEGASMVATAYFRDGATSSAPSTARYRVDCETTGIEIRGWTSLTPAASINITLQSTDNVIKNQTNPFEIRLITVEGNTGTSAVRNSAHWRVINLNNVS